MQILVLGVHRSGTSAVVRLLNMMGAYLGAPERIKGASHENPKGFWENEDVVDLNKAVLGAQRCLWNRLSEFDASKLADERLGTLRRRAVDLLIGLDAFRPWAIKDPRMCLLLPFWRPLLQVPVCVLVNRSALDVARSLRTRNDIPLHVGIAMWEMHNLEALRGSIGLPRILIQYADLLNDPVGSARSLLGQLQELGVRKLTCPSDEEIRAFIDPKLRHEKASPREQEDFLTPRQRCLHDALADGSAPDMTDVPPLSEAAREVLKAYDATLHAQNRVQHLRATAKQRERELEELRDASKQREEQAAHYQAKVKELQAALDKLENRVSELRVALSILEHKEALTEDEPAKKSREMEDLSGKLEELQAQVEAQREEIKRKDLETLKLQMQTKMDQEGLKSARKDNSALRGSLAALKADLGRRNADLRAFMTWLEDMHGYVGRMRHNWWWRLGAILRAPLRFLGVRSRDADLTANRADKLLRQVRDWYDDRYGAEPIPSASAGRPRPAEGMYDLGWALPERAHRTIDVVVCAHNALYYVKRCLESVAMNTPRRNSHVYVVNDGSDEETSAYLRKFCAKHDFATYMESKEAEGYTKAANRGMRASTADYVVLLNSDTIVPECWIDRIIECGESDERIGIVGPLSGAASYQSIPDIRTQEGEWSVNPLPDGVTVDDMADKVYELSDRLFPRVPFVNGFCYAIKRKVIEAIGLFEEETFPFGFGEENDYSLRAREAGFELAIADHGYVYHAKSRSYGPERRKALARTARQALEKKHGAEKIACAIKVMEAESSLAGLRQRVRDYLDSREGDEALPEVRGMRILYLLRGRGGGGGVHSIYQESTGMRKFGVYTQIALPKGVEDNYRRFYPDPPEGLFCFFQEESELYEHAKDFDIVVATIFTTVRPLKRLCEHAPHILPAYYIQDYEPWIIRDPTPELVQEAQESYTAIPDMVCFAKTDWIRETVHYYHGIEVNKVDPSLDTSVYHPGRIKRDSSGQVHIVAMVRPSTPRRAPKETMELLRTIQRRYPDRVRVTVFGNDPVSEGFLELPRDFEFENRGILIREEVADLLGSADVFVDLSTYQAFGRTGLEAMAVGCATLLPKKGGVYEYAVHRKNALIVDTSSAGEAVAALEELVTDIQLRNELKRNGLETASRFSVRSAVVSELKLFRNALGKKRGFCPESAPRVVGCVSS